MTLLADASSMLAIGSFWFWILVAVELVLVFAFVENEKGLLAGVSFGVFGLVLQFVFGVDIFKFIIENPWKIGVFAAAYVAIGITWSIFRFWWFVGTKFQEIADYEKNWMTRNGYQYDENGAMAPETVIKWNEYVDKNSPTALENKAFICRLIAYWPINVIWFLISDFVKEFFVKIYNRLSKVYEGIIETAKNKAKK